MLMVTADIAALCNYNSKCSSGFVKSFMIIEGSINVNDYVEEKTARKLCEKRGVRRKADVP